MSNPKFYMRWRESFENQEGWFETETKLKEEVLRILMLADEDEGEAMIYTIVKGKDVTQEFLDGKF